MSKPKAKPKKDEKSQRERFIEAARAAGADETREGLDRAFAGLTIKPQKKKSSRR